MEPRHYYAIVEGYQNKQKKKAELLRKSVWAAGLLASRDKPVTHDEFCRSYFPLWFDEIIDENFVPPTPEKVQEILARHEKYKKKKKK